MTNLPGLEADTLSHATETLLRHAWREATQRRHTLVTPSHLLLALCNDASIHALFTELGADTDGIETRLRAHLDAPTFPGRADHGQVRVSPVLAQLVRCAAVFSSMREDDVNAVDLLAATFANPADDASRLLETSGVNPYAVNHIAARPVTPKVY